MCMALATKKGCQLVRVDVNDGRAEQMYLTWGFELRATVDLRTLEKDLLDLSCITHGQVKVLTKRLEAQTTISSKL